jgi:protocatechuate 3,4-dioxygenase beta subunit
MLLLLQNIFSFKCSQRNVQRNSGPAEELHSFQNPASGSPAPGAIHGRVIEAKSGEPVKKAVVIIRRTQEPGFGAVTDPSGEFQFESVEPGAYTITAECSGFVIDPESQRTVEVKAENKAEAALKLIRTAAISGRVFDEDGDAVTGANVQIVPVNQKKGSGPQSSAVTNDRGEYRAFNVKPGRYRIAVSYTAPVQRMQMTMQARQKPRANGAEDTYAVAYYPAALDSKLGQIVNVEAGADLRCDEWLRACFCSYQLVSCPANNRVSVPRSGDSGWERGFRTQTRVAGKLYCRSDNADRWPEPFSSSFHRAGQYRCR